MKAGILLLMVLGLGAAMPVRAEQSLLARGRGAEIMALGYVAQIQDIYTDVPKMVKSEKGYVLDRGNPSGQFVAVLVQDVLKGKLARGLRVIYRSMKEKENPPLFYKSERVAVLLKKMPETQVDKFSLEKGDYYTLSCEREGVFCLDDQMGKDQSMALEATIKVDAEARPARKAMGVAERIGFGGPEPLALALFVLLAEVDPTPAVPDVLAYVEGHPKLYREACASLVKYPNSEKLKLVDRLAKSKKPGPRAMAVEWTTSPLEVPDKIDLLTKFAADPDEMVREALAKGLANCDPATRKPVLELLLKDTSPKVKAAAEASASR